MTGCFGLGWDGWINHRPIKHDDEKSDGSNNFRLGNLSIDPVQQPQRRTHANKVSRQQVRISQNQENV